jgi:hypothetical protein
MGKASPTGRTLTLLRAEGYTADVCERRLPRCLITRDLFGLFDVVAIRQGDAGVLGIQTTSGRRRCRSCGRSLAGLRPLAQGHRKSGRHRRATAKPKDHEAPHRL